MSERTDKLTFCSEFNITMRSWVAGNKRLAKALPYDGQLFRMVIRETGPVIHVNLNLFSEAYVRKFIKPNMVSYCENLIKAIDNRIHYSLAGSPPQLTIKYEFHYKESYLSRHVMYCFSSMIL